MRRTGNVVAAIAIPLATFVLTAGTFAACSSGDDSGAPALDGSVEGATDGTGGDVTHRDMGVDAPPLADGSDAEAAVDVTAGGDAGADGALDAPVDADGGVDAAEDVGDGGVADGPADASAPAWTLWIPGLYFGALEGAAFAGNAQGELAIAGTMTQAVDFGEGPIWCHAADSGFVATFGGDGRPHWSKCFDTQTARSMQLGSVAVDATGAALIAGTSPEQVDLGAGLVPAGDFVAKYDANGGLVFATALAAGGAAPKVVVDASGNAALCTGSAKSFTLQSRDPAGALRWSKSISGGGYSALTTGPNGVVAVAGSFTGSLDLGGTVLTSRSGYYDLYVAEYSSAGQLVSTYDFRDPDGDAAVSTTYPSTIDSMAFDSGGNLVLAGSFYEALAIGATVLRAPNTQSQDGFLASIDTAGTTRWARALNVASQSVGGSRITDVAADPAGDLVVTGGAAGAVDFGGGAMNLASGAFLARYDGSGNLRVVSTYPGQSGGTPAIDAQRNVYLGGGVNGTLDLGGGGSLSGLGVFVAKVTTPSGTGGPLLGVFDTVPTGGTLVASFPDDVFGGQTVSELALDDGTAYFGAGPAIGAVPLDGGAASTIHVTSPDAGTGPSRLATDGATLYWSDTSTNAIWTCGLPGCSSPTVLATSPPYVNGLQLAGGALYWMASTGGILRCALPGCPGGPSAVTGASTPSAFSSGSFAVTATAVFWVDVGTGSVMACPLPSCAGGPQALATGFKTPVAIMAIAADSAAVYFGLWDTQYPYDQRILECPLPSCAGGPTRLATTRAAPRALFVQGSQLVAVETDFIAGSGFVQVCSLPGCSGGPSTVASYFGGVLYPTRSASELLFLANTPISNKAPSRAGRLYTVPLP